MKVAVIPNGRAAGVHAALPAVCAQLQALGAQTLCPASGAFPSPEADELIGACDAVVALGGDGTIIHTAKRAAAFDRAVLGINCGTLGFMAGLEADELEQLAKLIAGEYTIESRMLLEVRVSGAKERRFYALNEAVVSRGSLSRIVELDICNHDKPVMTYEGDGVIVATPTGSTGYSLSAGGPVVDPEVSCLLVTPVCPHSLHCRSTIFSADAVLSVRANAERCPEIYLTVDGEEGLRVGERDVVTISRADRAARLIKIKQQSFYDVLTQKLVNR
ncbi:MAG: NAD(+)/NADH kinase [Clostridiales bacterium]|nr:NAD(+)/NADH kinase [Clostridiales bacterium]